MHLPQFSLIVSQTLIVPWQLSTGGIWGAGIVCPTIDSLIDALHFEATHSAPHSVQWDELRALERLHDA